MKNTRSDFRQKIQNVDPLLEYWMSEYCILEDNAEIKGSGRDLCIDPAIYLARVIQADLILAEANGWHWWLAVSSYDYKDRLIYIDLDKNSGNIYESKMLWALGHFSRFIRPGSVRISLERQDGSGINENINGLLASAYLTREDEIVIIFLNQLKSDKKVSFEGLSSEMDSVSVFQTVAVDDENLKLVDISFAADPIFIPSRSLVTCLIK